MAEKAATPSQTPVPKCISPMSRGTSMDLLQAVKSKDKAATKKKLYEIMDSALSQSDPDSVMKSIAAHFEHTLARTKWTITPFSLYQATAFSLRDRMIESWNDTQQFFYEKDVKRAYYMSIEFLMGRTLTNALMNTGHVGSFVSALKEFGDTLEDIVEKEHDAGLGSGGLGRLAACFLDSLATLNYPAWGYGIRYKYGQFKQNIVRGFQVETPDFWLENGNPWEICREDVVYPVGFYGSTRYVMDTKGEVQIIWEPENVVNAVAYDTPIPGFGTQNTLTLRLWSSQPVTEIPAEELGHKDPWDLLKQKQKDEDITAVLYPKADTDSGKELRLKQQYFFSSATLKDIIRRFKKSKRPLSDFPKLVAIQLNDTHPTISIPELMRLLMDVERLTWEEAWAITTKTFAFTNHTVLPEALEKWSVPLISRLLPRHAQIIFEINHRFLEMVRATFTQDGETISRLSIIEEGSPQCIRMANLAIVGSHTVNGVAKIHSEILQSTLFADWNKLWPGKIINITNGVTQRRWMYCCNPELSHVISSYLGSNEWVTDLPQVKALREKICPGMLSGLLQANRVAKERLRQYILTMSKGTIDVDVTALFDIQVKRIHEYKRQLLNILGVVHRYQHLKSLTPEQREKEVKRVNIFAGKAAASYHQAKAIVKLINNVSEVVNADTETNKWLKVIFIPNYSVSLAEIIIPATDLSEHISTAGMEASGTSNMKFCMNGGLLLGTLDGANVEISEACGLDNCFIFGATASDVDVLRRENHERPIDGRLYNVLHAINRGDFGFGEQFSGILTPISKGNDWYCVSNDFPHYLAAQAKVDEEWKNETSWLTKCINTISSMGNLSSDYSISQYAKKIWKIEPAVLPADYRESQLK